MVDLLFQLIRWLAALPPRAKLALMLASDAVFLTCGMTMAVVLRLGSFEDALAISPELQVAYAVLTLPVLAAAGLYREVVRYIELRVLLASGTALLVTVVGTYAVAYALDMRALPRTSMLIYFFIAFAYVVTSRVAARTLLRRSTATPSRTPVRTAIYGAGAAGAQLVYNMSVSTEYLPVCFLDDRVELAHKKVAGLRIYPASDLPQAVLRHAVELVVIAVPSATSAQKRAMIEHVESAGVPVKVLPSLSELVDRAPAVGAIREVDVTDLLGRDPVPPDPALFARNIAAKVVLVTGAGGSIGSEICRQVLTSRPAVLILLDHSEYSLYIVEMELRALAQDTRIVARLGSILDEVLLEEIVTSYGVNTVYHAAAYKHVPMVEHNLRQGITNNVFGTLAVSRVAARSRVATFVMVSTDKAVRPTSVMGASKRIAELIIQAAALRHDSRTVFSIVRFGNVLGSSGSVVPLFRKQISEGGPVTVTHPAITRYFMIIPEAAQLVIQAGAMAQGGEVFVLDMGEPVRVIDLARSLIRLSGLTERTSARPDGDIEIRAIGLRPGEKLYEELLIGDDVVPTRHRRILSARERHVEPLELDARLEALRRACDDNDAEAMLRVARELVPEYRDADEVNAEVDLAASS